MRRLTALLAASLLATLPGLATAQQAATSSGDWSHAQRVEVTLSSFRFDPRELHLPAGRPVILHLTNSDGGGHNFHAMEFFAAATVRPEDASRVHDGIVSLDGHQSVDIALVPRAGTYALNCTHAFHSTLGMRGRIVVE